MKSSKITNVTLTGLLAIALLIGFIDQGHASWWGDKKTEEAPAPMGGIPATEPATPPAAKEPEPLAAPAAEPVAKPKPPVKKKTKKKAKKTSHHKEKKHSHASHTKKSSAQ